VESGKELIRFSTKKQKTGFEKMNKATDKENPEFLYQSPFAF